MKPPGKHAELFERLRALYETTDMKVLVLEGSVIPGGHVIVGIGRRPSAEASMVFELKYDGHVHLSKGGSGWNAWSAQRETLEKVVTDLEERIAIGFVLLACGQKLMRSIRERVSRGGDSSPAEP